jgi:uncharacterized protein YjdB
MPTSVILTATPRNAAGAPLTGKTLTFASSDPSVATAVQISPTQVLVTAVAAGTADITATDGVVTSNVDTVTVS